jgi:hypothetical protein
MKDINLRNNTLYLQHTKNNKLQILNVPPTLAEALKDYIADYRSDAEPTEYLFPNGQNKQLTKDALVLSFGRFCKKRGTTRTTNHRQICSTVGCNQHQDQNHTWSNWTNTHPTDAVNQHRRTCSTVSCGRTEDQNHTWGTWWNHDATNHRRQCSTTTCARLQDQNHIWPTTGGSLNNGWQQGDDTNHSRTCTTVGCGRPQTQVHNWGSWVNLNATHHRRTCSLCLRINDADHVWNWTPLNQTQHRRTCSTADCGRVETANHNFSGSHAWYSISLNQYFHNFWCSVCWKLRSGTYNCVHNASGICVGGTYISANNNANTLNVTVGNTNPSAGCGRNMFIPGIPGAIGGPYAYGMVD